MALDGLTLALEGIGRGPEPTAHFGFWPATSLEDYGYTSITVALTAYALLSTTMVDDITISVSETASALLAVSQTDERAELSDALTDTATLSDSAVWTATLEDIGDAD